MEEWAWSMGVRLLCISPVEDLLLVVSVLYNVVVSNSANSTACGSDDGGRVEHLLL